MKIKIEIMGPANKKLPTNPAIVDMPEGSKLIDLMKSIGYTETEAKYLVYVRGEERIKLNTPLSDNDFIKAVLQVGGG